MNLKSGSTLAVWKQSLIIGTLTVDESSQLTVDYGEDGWGNLTVDRVGTLTVDGSLTVRNGYLNNFGKLTLSKDAVAHLNGNGYYLANGDGGEMTISGELTVSNNCSLDNNEGGTLTNTGEMENNGTLNVSDGALALNGALTMGSGSKLNVGSETDSSSKMGKVEITGSGPFDTVNGTITLHPYSIFKVAKNSGVKPSFVPSGGTSENFSLDGNGDYFYENTGTASGAVLLSSDGTYAISYENKSCRRAAGKIGVADVNGAPIGGYTDGTPAVALFTEPWAHLERLSRCCGRRPEPLHGRSDSLRLCQGRRVLGGGRRAAVRKSRWQPGPHGTATRAHAVTILIRFMDAAGI